MVETAPSQIWGMRFAYVGLCCIVLFFHMMPLSTSPQNWAGPDIIVALTFAWAVRRPDYVPALLIAAVLLFSDLMLHRPPGLFAACILIAAESLKTRVQQVRNEGFFSEMVLVMTMLALSFLGIRVVMAVLLVPLPPLGLALMQAVLTAFCYPVIVFVSQIVFGVRPRLPRDESGRGSFG